MLVNKFLWIFLLIPNYFGSRSSSESINFNNIFQDWFSYPTNENKMNVQKSSPTTIIQSNKKWTLKFEYKK